MMSEDKLEAMHEFLADNQSLENYDDNELITELMARGYIVIGNK